MASDLITIRPKQAVAQNRIPLSSSSKRFLFTNLGEAEERQCQLFAPKGEFWHYLEQALDLSENVSEQAKRDLGDSLLKCYPLSLSGYTQFSIFKPLTL